MSRAVHLENFITLSIILFICDLGANNRIIFPTDVEVREGEDLEVRLLKVLENERSCYVRTPLHVNCNLKVADYNENATCGRIHYWPFNGSCGFYITNIQKQDDGPWRLTSKIDKDNKTIDVVVIKVLDKFDESIEKVQIIEGLMYRISFPGVEYCMVQRPHNPNKIIDINKCNIDTNITAVDHGNWSAIVGIKGKIEETMKVKHVSIFQEHLDSGYNVSSDHKALHLYCNLKSYKNSLSMCRFAKSSVMQMGLRLRDGLRKGRYGYYGNGLAQGDCGLTIQSPKEEDYGQWHCMLVVANKSLFGTIIQVLKPTNETFTNDMASLSSHTLSVTPVYTAVREVLKLECSSNVPLKYCRFSMPHGETFISGTSPDILPSLMHSYPTFSDYELLAFGNCSIMIQAAETKHNGTWTCYMGPASLGIELSHEIVVRVAETPLAAVDKFVSPDKNGTITLRCKTVPRVMPLTYCRFQSPSGFGMNIDERITKDNPIQENGTRYWYSGRSIAVGDCGLVIENGNSMHVGKWMCAAKLDSLEKGNSNNETFDTIYVVNLTNENEAHSIAGATTGIVFGVIIVLMVLGLLIITVRKKIMHSRLQHNQYAPRYPRRPYCLHTLQARKTTIKILALYFERKQFTYM